MTDGTEAQARPPRSTAAFTFWSGGWVLLLAGLMMAGVCVWRVPGIIRSLRTPAIGDGRTVASYGFDLSTCLVARDTLVAAGFSKDGLRAPLDPPTLTVSDIDEINQKQHGKFLVPSDRVIGVEISGEARAYPLRLLVWHEVVNDTVAGKLIAVTYSPLCDSSVVFDRKVGDETLTFGVSGLLFNSNLLMYDRRPDGRGESLWCQLQFRAVAGPAAAVGRELEIVQAEGVHWGDWRQRHPQTRVLAPDPSKSREYKREPYASYFGSDLLEFPVAPLPPAGGLALKAPVIAVRVDEQPWTVFPLVHIAAEASPGVFWQAYIGPWPVGFNYEDSPPVAWADVDDKAGSQWCTVTCCWFAWYAMHPNEASLVGKP